MRSTKRSSSTDELTSELFFADIDIIGEGSRASLSGEEATLPTTPKEIKIKTTLSAVNQLFIILYDLRFRV
ncbi:hypothetical protein C4E22_01565 [ANME-1 cluster archaeon AG-394-G06]|nr:hypothetical protein [ANME-1 cluster archaeon AG-394-G06]